MKWSPATQGRAFVLRLEDGEVLHEQIERFAREQSVLAAAVIAVGAAGEGSRLVVGPADADARPIDPMEHVLGGVHEIAGTGTLFPDADGAPLLHMNAACGRGESTARRAFDSSLGFQLLEP